MSQMDGRRIREIFLQSQHSATSHEKLCKQMRQLYEKMPEENFLDEFTNCLKVPFIHGEKHPSVENTLNFAAKFSVSLLQPRVVKPPDTIEGDEEDEEMCPFLLNVFKFLFENHNTENQAIRFRVCQFVNKLLNSLGNEACIDDNLCDDISDCMMERLQDKAPMVRVQALMALHRLQDPSDPNCPVMKAFMFHMSSDPSADVRRAVITNIAMTAQSVRCILERTHDLKDVVRRTAYMSLSKLSVQRFTINQRVRLLTDGLKDHSEIVRNCVSKVMLPSWLQGHKGNFLSLLHALDCENSTEISTLALQTLFKTEQIRNVLDQLTKVLNKDIVIPIDELTPENSLYWRVLSEYLEAHPEIADERPIDEPLPEILPELTTFCNYIRKFYLERSVEEVEHWVRLQHQYILQQLLELCKGFDLADEMGRANLRQLCLDLLTSERVSEDVAPVVVEVMVKVVPDVEDRLQALAEVISEVREPMGEQEGAPEPPPQLPPEDARQLQLKQAMIRVKINEKKEEQDEAIKEQDFVRAQQIKEEWQKLQVDLEALAEAPRPEPPVVVERVRDEVKDRAALCKCLRIVREMVQSDSVKSLTATLRSLMHNFVLPCLQDLNTKPVPSSSPTLCQQGQESQDGKMQEDNSIIIRRKALEALGLFSLLDQELAKENFVMFCFQIANDEVCEVALKVTFDLLHLYGLEAFQVEEDENGKAGDKKKSKKKKKNLFVTDLFDDEFDDDEENQENLSQLSSGSSANTANLIAMLTSLLDSASTSMRNLAMEGLYKLLMACRITSSALLSRLILMWYSPVTEGDEALRQPLGVFLTVYAAHCPRSQETLEQAFLPTLRTLMQAPVISPLSQVDQDSVARLFISLTRPGCNKYHAKGTHIHNNMAISLCNEIWNAGDDTINIGCLLRALLQLELSLEDPVFHEDLKTLIKNLAEGFRNSREKQYLRYIDRFRQMIDTIETTIQSSVVNNTAVTAELEGTQSQSVNTTASSVVDNVVKKGKGYSLLRKVHPISEDPEDEEDDDNDSVESPDEPPSSIVIPPSPVPSEGEDDVFEEDADGGNKPSSESTRDDDVFKQPLLPNRRVRAKKGLKSNGSDSEKEDGEKASNNLVVSSRSTRRGAQASQLQEEEATNAHLVRRVNSGADLQKSRKGKESHVMDAAVLEVEKVADKASKVTRETKNTSEENTTKIVKQKSNLAVSPNSGRPKREIHPTEKGASLKTFQTSVSEPSPASASSPPSTSPPPHVSRKAADSSSQDSSPERPKKIQKLSGKSSQALRQSTRSSSSQSRVHSKATDSSSQDSSPDGPARVVHKLSERSKRQIGGSARYQPGNNRDQLSVAIETGPKSPPLTRHEQKLELEQLQKGHHESTRTLPSSVREKTRRANEVQSSSPVRRTVCPSTTDSDTLSSPSPSASPHRGRSLRMKVRGAPSPSKEPLMNKDESARHSCAAHSQSEEEIKSPAGTKYLVNYTDSNSSSASKEPRSLKGTICSPFTPSSRSGAGSVESSPVSSSRHLRSGTSSVESPSGSSFRSLRSGTNSVESSPSPLRRVRGTAGSSDNSPAHGAHRRVAKSSSESSPASNTHCKQSVVSGSQSSSGIYKKVNGARSARVTLTPSSSDTTPPRTRRSISNNVGQGGSVNGKDKAPLLTKPSKSKDQAANSDSPALHLRVRGRISGKGKDTDDEASPIQPRKKQRTRTPDKESPNLRPGKSARFSRGSNSHAATPPVTTRSRIKSHSGVKTRRQ